MIYYFVILSVCFIAALFYKQKLAATVIATIILAVFAGTRLNIDNDYWMYKDLFGTRFRSIKEFYNLKINVEYCIFFMDKIARLIFYSKTDVINFSFLVFACLGVSTKMIAIHRYSVNYILSIFLYVSYLFLMQEMTTIRAGIAAGIFLLSLPYLIDKNYFKFFLIILTSFFFHNSSVLFVLVSIMIMLNLKIKYYYYALGASFLIIITNQNLLQILFLDRIFPRVAVYLEIMQWSKEDALNIFNFKILISILFFLIFAFNYKKLKDDRWFEVLFRINIMALVIFFALSNTAMVFSARSFDLLSVVQILLFPMILRLFKDNYKVFAWILIISCSLLQLYYLVDVSEIYKPYRSWLF
ncbi:EpsG family protein [Kaistella palustris]|uniref:EpsG family protein n=1 Tax=Kaistella palustris TaxID=493376 RepID=UPI00048386DB|nr:EpsG family protein [Kaistella palustris]